MFSEVCCADCRKGDINFLLFLIKEKSYTKFPTKIQIKFSCDKVFCQICEKLEDTVCSAGLLLATSEGFGLWAKKELFMLFWPILGHF